MGPGDFETPTVEEPEPISEQTGRIYWIGGTKDCVGKSMLTVSTIDCVLERGDKALLVECDTSNPDGWRTYKELVPAKLIALDEADDWIDVVNTCDTHRNSLVVVNSAARKNVSVRTTVRPSTTASMSSALNSWRSGASSGNVTAWSSLRDCLEALPKADVHVVQNGYFGDKRKFEIYSGFEIREAVKSRGGKSVTFPDLADRVADDIYAKRLALSAAAQALPIGDRSELARWRGEVRNVPGEVVA
jgi:hypothetical protein